MPTLLIEALGTASSRRRGSIAGRKLLLTMVLVLPVAAVLGLVLSIGPTLKNRLAWRPEPVGAGAGSTAGANAIGEWLAGNAPNRSAGSPRGAGAPADGAAPDAAPNGAAAPVAPDRADEGEARDAHEAQPSSIDPATLEQGFWLVVEDQSKLATAASPIYIAGNFNGWNPADPAFKLEAQSDLRWRIRLVKPVSRGNPSEPIEFKFTRGSWELEELRADMSVPGNRRLPRFNASALRAGESPLIELAVPHWGDERPEFKDRATRAGVGEVKVSTGTIRRVQVTGGAGRGAARPRDLLVWLPPGYDDPANASATYPVLYMMDGQNLFDVHPGAPAEWGVDEAMGELLAAGRVRPIIVVGVPHAGVARVEEYIPPVTREGILDGRPPAGDEFVAWMRREVMPRVERSFRVKAGPEHTAIGGSSLGGLIALYAGVTHPDAFGLVLAESPALTFSQRYDWRVLFAGVERWPRRAFLGVGGKEGGENAERSAAYAGAVKELHSRMAKGGGEGVRFVYEPEATHHERAWRERLPVALEFLFPKQ